ncbi:MAG: recombination mediator RecR [Arcobacteraceae bacterium]|nr:recombination mediator RecR [Arcobacteraceae bacterium]
MSKKGLDKFYNLVESFENLPAIGKKSALRLAYHIVYENSYSGLKLAHSIEDAIATIKKCTICNSMSEHEICDICLDSDRAKERLCIVQSAKDIFNVEDSKQYDGTYFVLEHLDEENLDKLKKIIAKNDTKDILFAITPSLANDAFILYIEDRLKPYDIKFTKIAQGVPTGVSLENVDILSLSKAIKCSVDI